MERAPLREISEKRTFWKFFLAGVRALRVVAVVRVLGSHQVVRV